MTLQERIQKIFDTERKQVTFHHEESEEPAYDYLVAQVNYLSAKVMNQLCKEPCFEEVFASTWPHGMLDICFRAEKGSGQCQTTTGT